MYKKPFVVQGQNLLSKKDVRALKTQAVEQFPGLDEKTIDELLPEGHVKVLKLDNRCLLYSVDDEPPAFFDAEGQGELYPTLRTLWLHPNMMLELTIHAPVSKFVLNGADLMLPGVEVPANGVAGFGTVTKGQRRCIKIAGNPYPIAVGKMLVNQAQMEKLKGKGLEVLHVFKDTLWAFACKSVPNAGFAEKDDEITPCNDCSWKPGAVPAAPAGATSAPAAAPAATPSAADGETKAADEPAPASPAVAAAEPGKKDSARAPEDWSQDELLEFCFMQAFRCSLTDEKALPIEASELYEKHMKPMRPEGTTLDVKKSSHKQIGKFLNVMRKAKVIEVVEKKDVVSVSKVNMGHKLFKELGEKFSGDAAAVAVGSASGPAVASGPPPPEIITVWKPSHYLEGLFKAAGKSKNDLLRWDDARSVLTAYIEKEGLGKASGGPVKLNDELITALVKAAGGEKKGTSYPEEMDLEELEEKMQERMQEHTTVVVAGVGPTTRKGPAVKLEVTLSRKGAHNVTRICNLEAYGLEVEAMGEELKKKLNCTVHYEDMPGKSSKDKMMQLQGHVAQELCDYMLQKYGIPKSFFSIK